MDSEIRTSGCLRFEQEVRPANFAEWLEKRFQLTPFASLGSNQDPAEPRWMSFLVATVHQHGKLSRLSEPAGDVGGTEPSWKLPADDGRYPFYQQQRPAQAGLHLLLNGLAGGSLAGNLKLLRLASRPGARLSAKRLLFQWPATLDESGPRDPLPVLPGCRAQGGPAGAPLHFRSW